jgi:hypothetical protein
LLARAITRLQGSTGSLLPLGGQEYLIADEIVALRKDGSFVLSRRHSESMSPRKRTRGGVTSLRASFSSAVIKDATQEEGCIFSWVK